MAERSNDGSDLERKLEAEIDKWKQKLSQENLEDLKGDKEFIDNIRAYADDADYFYEQDKLIKSFEALIWAWAWLEIGNKYNFVD